MSESMYKEENNNISYIEHVKKKQSKKCIGRGFEDWLNIESLSSIISDWDRWHSLQFINTGPTSRKKGQRGRVV